MKKKNLLKKVIDAIRDPEREFIERVFLALTIISEITVFAALVGDIAANENPLEIAVLVGTLIVVPVLVYFCLQRNKLKFAIKLTVILLIFIIMPALFFFGGGLEGGGVLWIIFTFTYVGLVLSGSWRIVMLIMTIVLAAGCYLAEYFYPDIVNEHSRGMFFIDSFISLVLVGAVCFLMTWLQNILFMDENARARKAAEKAEELTRAQNRFFSSMSHEIRTPINSILGLNELILRDQDASDEIVKDAMGIQGSGKMLLALINDILDFSKMEAGSMDIVPVDYRIGDMLSEIVNMIWIRANDKGLKFNVTIDPKVPTVLYGDEVRIKQVIINLLNNAVKYTPEGSVELHVESEEKDEKNVELSIFVTDTGMGIKKETLPYLFDAFKRVDEEKNRHIEGTGLGLSIVKQLVELMNGTITVNSVYGEGSTFTVVLTQGISDPAHIGDLSIHNQGTVRRNAYECSFRAPEARILIVDDNEMNLEVESKLLIGTEMNIDKALSGKAALELTVQKQYDTIFMDHLMPEMDGIECLENIRRQSGGMNRNTPVIVLTANAGSENRELYNRAGFNGYMVKPVSGEALENILTKYISADKLILNSNKLMTNREDINAGTGYTGKVPVIITSTSMCDLPDSIIKKLNIPILPFLIRTEEGIFKDGRQMGADELIRYLNTGKNAVSSPPDEAAYTEFFASVLKRAHHLIHIALTSGMSEDYHVASEAARSFDNVTVINSECLSSATGILVMIAHKLAQMNVSVEEIVSELETVKHRLKCSFIIDTTEYMARKGLISSRVDRFARGLNLHPCLRIKDDKSGIGGVWIGNRRRVYKKYITKAFPVDVIPDPEVVFVTYVDVPIETLLWIKEEISKIVYFENVVFMQASAAISSNCGPGTFGILYFVKSNKSYNLASFIDKETLLVEDESGNDTEGSGLGIKDESEEDEADKKEGSEISETAGKTEVPAKWYDDIEGIDGKAAVKNSGSEDSFKTVLGIFYSSIDDRSAELERFYAAEDWDNYTIKVHALKSSAKLIGAMGTAEKSQLLENAGKEGNIGYIKENHAALIEEFRAYKGKLNPFFGKKEEEEQENTENGDDDRPELSGEMLSDIYDRLRTAVETMNCDDIEDILKETEGYALPESDREKLKNLSEMADLFNYDGMLELLNEK